MFLHEIWPGRRAHYVNYDSNWGITCRAKVGQYCSSVWDPYTQTLIKQIEAVQNRAARFVTGNHSRRSSVTAMKLKLNWEPLELRRKVGRLTNFHEAIAGRLAIPVRSALRPAGRNLRQPLQQIVISPYQQISNCINSHSFRAQYQNGINCLTL